MKGLLISIIIPAYNIEAYIERCLDSLLVQTYKHIEIIIVDDGSTDQTGVIVDRYASHYSHIKAIHKKNGGVSSARMMGVKEASGDFIGFVDGDDFVEANMFEILLRNAIERDVDISHCGYQMVFPNGRVDYYYNTGETCLFNHLEGLKELLSGSRIEPGLWNKLYRKELFDSLDLTIWDESIRINEDLLLNYLLFKNAQSSYFEDQSLYHYMLRKGSAATSNIQSYKLTDPYKVIKLIMDDVEDDDLKEIVFNKYISILFRIATQKHYSILQRKAKRLLLLEKELDDFKKIGKRMRYQIELFSLNEHAYYFVRKIYCLITKNDKKYHVE